MVVTNWNSFTILTVVGYANWTKPSKYNLSIVPIFYYGSCRFMQASCLPGWSFYASFLPTTIVVLCKLPAHQDRRFLQAFCLPRSSFYASFVHTKVRLLKASWLPRSSFCASYMPTKVVVFCKLHAYQDRHFMKSSCLPRSSFYASFMPTKVVVLCKFHAYQGTFSASFMLTKIVVLCKLLAYQDRRFLQASCLPRSSLCESVMPI